MFTRWTRLFLFSPLFFLVPSFLTSSCSTFHPQGWKNTYSVKTREELEAKLKKDKHLSFQWKQLATSEMKKDGTDSSDGYSIEITSGVVPAVHFISEQHGNFIYQNTFQNSLISAFQSHGHIKAVFGDNSDINAEIMKDITAYADSIKVVHKWKQGTINIFCTAILIHTLALLIRLPPLTFIAFTTGGSVWFVPLGS